MEPRCDQPIKLDLAGAGVPTLRKDINLLQWIIRAVDLVRSNNPVRPEVRIGDVIENFMSSRLFDYIVCAFEPDCFAHDDAVQAALVKRSLASRNIRRALSTSKGRSSSVSGSHSLRPGAKKSPP